MYFHQMNRNVLGIIVLQLASIRDNVHKADKGTNADKGLTLNKQRHCQFLSACSHHVAQRFTIYNNGNPFGVLFDELNDGLPLAFNIQCTIIAILCLQPNQPWSVYLDLSDFYDFYTSCTNEAVKVYIYIILTFGFWVKTFKVENRRF